MLFVTFGFLLQPKSLRIGLLNSNLISCHRDIYCVAYMGASKSYHRLRSVFTLKEASVSSPQREICTKVDTLLFDG